MAPTEQQILDYKDKLERGVSYEKTLHILHKLQKIPVTIPLLLETGIGKTVRQIGKLHPDSDVGRQAKILCSSWKKYVKAQEEQEEAQLSNASAGEEAQHNHLDGVRIKKEKDEEDEGHPPSSHELEEEEERASYSSYAPDSGCHTEYSPTEYEPVIKQEKEEIPRYDPTPIEANEDDFRDRKEERKKKKEKEKDGHHKSHKHHRDREGDSDERRHRHKHEHKEKDKHKEKHKSDKKRPLEDKDHDEQEYRKHKFLKPDTSEADSRKSKDKPASLFNGLYDNESVSVKDRSTKELNLQHIKKEPSRFPTNTDEIVRIRVIKSERNDRDDDYEQKTKKIILNVPKPNETFKKSEILTSLDSDRLVTDYKPIRFPMIPETSKRTSSNINVQVNGDLLKRASKKMAVFSGSSRAVYYDEVYRLEDLCIRALMDNPNVLKNVGNCPFWLIKPVLLKMNVDQLYKFEWNNPQLEDETDELWQEHVRRDFKKDELPDEDDESWRKYYFHLKEERDAKLKAITSGILKRKKEREEPVRKSKLAALPSVVKPSTKEVLRRQHEESLRCAEPITVPNPSVRKINESNGGGRRAVPPPKPKKAPLMANCLRAIKKGFMR